jgi:tetratricopeptide (TPR) repeat protein
LYRGADEGNIAEAVAAQGKKQQSLEWFNRSLASMNSAMGNMNSPSRIGQSWMLNTTTNRAVTLEQLGQFGEAIADWERVLELAPAERKGVIRLRRALCYAQSNKADEAVAEAGFVVAETSNSSELLVWAARVYARAAEFARDKNEKYLSSAIALLRTAEKAGEFNTDEKIASIKEDPHLTSVRSHPEFQDWLAKVRPTAN